MSARAHELSAKQLLNLPRRWKHVQSVAQAAAAAAPLISAAHADSIIAAAWLHDIGYAENLTATGFLTRR